jgi:hypothetical protein
MLPRLDEIEDDLLARRARAEHEAWLGEVEGIDLGRGPFVVCLFELSSW